MAHLIYEDDAYLYQVWTKHAIKYSFAVRAKSPEDASTIANEVFELYCTQNAGEWPTDKFSLQGPLRIELYKKEKK